MKKLFFVAALGVAGFVNANGNIISNEKNANVGSEIVAGFNQAGQNQEFSSKKVFKRLIRVTVHTTCGETYSQVLSFDLEPTDEDFIGIANAVQFALCDFGNDDGWDIAQRSADEYDVTVKR